MFRMTRKLFNLDLHISVIADVREILERLFPGEIKVDAWSLSGHTWVFGRRPDPVEVVRPETWRGFNEAMVQTFLRRYGAELSQYDGFIITHTPVFCRLVESFGKPVFMVASCRYDQPYCLPGAAHPAERAALNACLRRMYERGQLVPVANNLADRDYLELGTGIRALYIPSLCLYTKVKAKAEAEANTTTIACSHRDCIPADIEAMLRKKPASPYAWADLYESKALVYIPYEVSTMSLFEAYSTGVPLIFPTKAFYRRLILEGKAVMASFNSGNYCVAAIPETLHLDWWLDRCDFYPVAGDGNDDDPEEVLRMTGIHYFDSWEDLKALISRANQGDLKGPSSESLAARQARVEALWNGLVEKYL